MPKIDLSEFFSTDKSKEEGGTWVPSPFAKEEDFEYLIARAGNDEWEKLGKKLWRPYEKMRRTNNVPEKVTREILIALLANTALKGWKGPKTPFSVDAAIELLTSSRDHRDFIASAATEAAAYEAGQEEERRGNSSTASPSTSSGAA